ncbi:hypothetical protein [Scytonema sp. HK-05]|uniref:hypothetical protein n=2 Tax=Scytonema sp. HK-05 TaxID=1137095 RepID=UPI0013017922|nr:hypothetical protein [Scytonema sp. HK-05]
MPMACATAIAALVVNKDARHQECLSTELTVNATCKGRGKLPRAQWLTTNYEPEP